VILSLSVLGLVLGAPQLTGKAQAVPNPSPSPTPSPAASAKPAPRPAAAPAAPAATKTTFASVLAGKLPSGRTVEFPAVLLPATAVQTISAGKTRYFVLAVAKDSAYMRGIAAEAEKLGPMLEKAKELPALVASDEKYRALFKEVDAALTAAMGTDKLSRTADVPPEEAIVVEVSGMESLKGVYTWESVKDPLFTFSPPPPLTSVADRFGSIRLPFPEVATRQALVNLVQGRPPDLGKSLPDFPDNPKLADERELESFNAAVEVYNNELKRRRAYSAQRTAEDVRVMLARFERILAYPEQPVVATVGPKVEIASDTYTKIHGRSPSVFVRERGRAPATFTGRYFATTDMLVFSYPPGATVSLGGQEMGTTPYVARGVAVGTTLPLSLTLAGHRVKEVSEAVAAQASGVKRLDYGLEAEEAPPTRLMTDDEAKRVFTADFKPARPFRVHVFTPGERPAEKGKKPKIDKKDKKFVEWAEELRGLVAVRALWFQAAATAEEADISFRLMPNTAGQSPEAVLHTRVRAGGETTTSEAPHSFSSEKDGAGRVLVRVAERLKSCCWTRMLAADAAP
jgi:hypothetical protein